MGLFNRKSQFERLLDAVDDVLDELPGELKGLPKGGSGKALKAGLITAARPGRSHRRKRRNLRRSGAVGVRAAGREADARRGARDSAQGRRDLSAGAGGGPGS